MDTKSSFNGQMPDTISRLIIQKNFSFSNLDNLRKVIKQKHAMRAPLSGFQSFRRYLSFEKDICYEKS